MMNYEIKQEQGRDALFIYLEGVMDTMTSPSVEEEILKVVREQPSVPLVLDLNDLQRISSAGLRVIFRLSKMVGAPFRLVNASPEVYEVFQVTGFCEIVDVNKRPQEVLVEGCEVIGQGAYGTVYRIDPDTVVKVYEHEDAVEMIRREQKLSKLAFLKGIPTAISYDLVKVGPWYGSMFEMIKAETLNDLLIKEPARQEEFIRTHADVMHCVHSVEMNPGELPDNREIFMKRLELVKDVLPKDTVSRLKELLEAMPEDLHLIHGDFHMKNVMISEGEPLLIDMETLSTGDPVFDFAGLFVTYVLFNEDEHDNSTRFLHIPEELSNSLARRILEAYADFGEESHEEEIIDRARALAYLQFVYLLHGIGVGDPALKEKRLEHSARHLSEILSRIDSLAIGDLL